MTVFLRITAAITIGLGAAGGAFASIEKPPQESDVPESYAPYYASASSSAVEESALVSASVNELVIDDASTSACTACEELLCDVCCPATWYVSAGAIVLHR